MASPSKATRNSLGSRPEVLAFATSEESIWRLALARSAVPFRSAAIPTPEPPPDTSTETLGSTLAYASAQAWARLTMVSEPMSWRETFLAALGCSSADFLAQPSGAIPAVTTHRANARARNGDGD